MKTTRTTRATLAAALCGAAMLASGVRAGEWSDLANRDTDWGPVLTSGSTNYVATAAELAQFAHLVNNGTTFSGTTVLITDSLDLSAHYWKPAGDPSHVFRGALTAAPGVLLDGMTINAVNLDTGLAAVNGYAGLIGYSNGRIDNIALTNTLITIIPAQHSHYIGGIAGRTDTNGRITDCSNHGSITVTVNGSHTGTTYPQVGGIAGYIGAPVTDCLNLCAVTVSTTGRSMGTLGGIAGYGAKDSGPILGNSGGNIIRCENRAPVSMIRGAGSVASTPCVGGISGQHWARLTDCVNYGSVTNSVGGYTGGITGGYDYKDWPLADCVNYGDIINVGGNAGVSDNYIGGIASDNEASIVTACVNHGAVINGASGGYTAGIIAQNNGVIINCENLGAVSHTATSGYAAAIVSRNNNDANGRGTLANCPNRGAISGPTSGGIAGVNNGDVLNCVNYAPVAGASRGGLAALNGGGVLNSYWNTSAAGNGSLPGVGMGAAATGCSAFGSAPGTLDTPVTVGATAAASLLDALNAWVIATPPRIGKDNRFYCTHRYWGLDTSTDGYPAFSTPTRWSHSANRDAAWAHSTTPGSVNFIGTAGELAQFAYLVSTGTNFLGTTNIITTTLDLSGHDWMPAGNAALNRRFRGTLTAAPGVVINGMTILTGNISTATDNLHAGLIGCVGINGRLDNITLTNTLVKIIHGSEADAYTGALAAYNVGTVTNCVNHGSILVYLVSGAGAYAYTGGIVGYNDAYDYSVTIADCVNHAPVTSASLLYTGASVGGIAGYNYGYDGLSVVTRCVNHGAVTATLAASSTSINAGGIVGHNYDSMVTDCANHGAVNAANNGNGTGNAGGIVGAASSYYGRSAVTRCANHGLVSGTSHSSHVGGILGHNEQGAIANCVNRGAVFSASRNTYVGAGGIAGYHIIGGNLANCANYGPVHGERLGGDFPAYIGGIAGQLYNGATAANSVNHGPVTSANTTGTGILYTGALWGLNNGSHLSNAYWNASVPANALLPPCGMEAPGSTTANCAPFTAPPGTLDSAVTIAGTPATTTDDLLAALNAWLDTQHIAISAFTYYYWTLDGSPDSYPILSDIPVPPPSVTVTFSGNGGDPDTQDMPQTLGEPYILPAADPTRDGHTFAGWFTEAEGGDEVTAADTVMTSAAHTLHAHWTPDAQPPPARAPYLADPADAMGAVPVTTTSYAGFAYDDATGTVRGTLTLSAKMTEKKNKKDGTATTNWTFTAKAVLQNATISFKGPATNMVGRFRAETKNAAETLDVTVEHDRIYGTLSGIKVGAALTVDGARDIFANKKDELTKEWLARNAKAYYTATLIDDATADAAGYLTLTVGNLGSVKLAGKLSDGTAVSGSAKLLHGLNDAGWLAIPLHKPLYSKKGFIGGLLWLSPGAINTDRVLRIDTEYGWHIDWVCADPNKARFERELDMCGGYFGDGKKISPALAPPYLFSVSVPTNLPPMDATLENWKWAETAYPVGLNVIADIAKSKLSLAKGVAPVKPVKDAEQVYDYSGTNSALATLSYTAKTGIFKGGFKLYFDGTKGTALQHKTASVSYAGVLTPVRDADHADWPIGLGCGPVTVNKLKYPVSVELVNE